MKYLEEQQVPAMIACPIRGKKDPEPSATRALCQGRKSYWAAYTFSNGETSFFPTAKPPLRHGWLSAAFSPPHGVPDG